jgi:heme/copper-type cytochrome/quinol oxidase subunit 2
MAEIHVRAKKHNTSNTMWIWIVIALLVIATVIYFVMRNNDSTPNNTTTPAYPTSQVQSTNDFAAINAA